MESLSVQAFGGQNNEQNLVQLSELMSQPPEQLDAIQLQLKKRTNAYTNGEDAKASASNKRAHDNSNCDKVVQSKNVYENPPMNSQV